MSLSPEQLAQRLEGITATDIGAIVGVHPHKSAVNVWDEKTGRAPPFLGNLRTKWGEILEKPVRLDYEQRHQVVVMTSETLAHPEFPWMLATPDGIVYRSRESTPCRGWEGKCHTVYLAREYGAPNTDEVPDLEICQTMWGMAVTSLPRWDLTVFMDNQPTDYVIMRDDELIGSLVEKGERFLVDNVRARKPPEPDGTDAYTEWLGARHKANAKADLVPVDHEPSIMDAIHRLREARREIRKLEKGREQLEQILKAAIGDASGATFHEFGSKVMRSITWKNNKSSSKIDHAEMAAAIRTKAQLVASSQAGTLERAIVALSSHLERPETYANSRATITNREIHAMLIVVRDAFLEIASDRSADFTTTTDGARPFVVPSHWNKDK